MCDVTLCFANNDANNDANTDANTDAKVCAFLCGITSVLRIKLLFFLHVTVENTVLLLCETIINIFIFHTCLPGPYVLICLTGGNPALCDDNNNRA